MLNKIISYILIYSLFVSSTAFAAMNEAQCRAAASQGFIWSSYGRCIQSTAANAIQNEYEQCATDKNPKECAEKLARADATNKTNSGDLASDLAKDSYWKSKIGGVPTILAHLGILAMTGYVVMYWSKINKLKKKNPQIQCNPASMILMSAGAASLLISEAVAYLSYNKKIRDIKNELAEYVQPDVEAEDYSSHNSAKEVTLLAYNSLIKQEEAFLAATKTRQIGYGIASAAFLSSATLSAIEYIEVKTGDATKNTEPRLRNLCPKLGHEQLSKEEYNKTAGAVDDGKADYDAEIKKANEMESGEARRQAKKAANEKYKEAKKKYNNAYNGARKDYRNPEKGYAGEKSVHRSVTQNKDILKDKTETELKNLESAVSSKSGGKINWMTLISVVGGLGAVLPMLFKKTSSLNEQENPNSLHEVYSSLGDKVEPKMKSHINKIVQASDMHELTVILDENRKIQDGELSSPSLKEYQGQNLLAFQSADFDELKKGLILSEMLQSEAELLEILMSGQELTSVE